MKKKIAIVTTIIMFGVFTALNFSACIFDSCNKTVKYKFTEVSNYEEYINTTGPIKLVADIDCDFALVPEKSMSAFEGNGYTIKNANLSGNSLFKDEPKYIKDVTFENLTYTSQGVSSVGLLLTYSETPVYGSTFENVTLKNCTINAKSPQYVGAFMGHAFEKRGVYYSSGNDKIDDSRDKTTRILNCSIENLNINVEGNSEKIANIGGFVGLAENTIIEGCKIKSSNISFTSSEAGSEPCMGGIVGQLSGSISKSGAYNNKVYFSANGYKQISDLVVTNTTNGNAGGIIGKIYNGELSQCYFVDGTVSGNCTGNAVVGGIVGYAESTTLSQSYVQNSKVSSGIILYQSNINLDKGGNTHVGGFIGIGKKCTISSSFVAEGTNGEVYLSSSVAGVCNGYGKVAGFAASADGCSLSYCSTYVPAGFNDTEFQGYGRDAFCFGGMLTNCFATRYTTYNTNNIEIISEEIWLSNDIKIKLRLDDNWNVGNNKLPYLNF